MQFTFYGWRITVERIPKPVIKVIPQPPASKKKKYKPQKCLTTGKIMFEEALCKLRAKELAKKSPEGYLRAYKCQFCESWHLTHKRRWQWITSPPYVDDGRINPCQKVTLRKLQPTPPQTSGRPTAVRMAVQIVFAGPVGKKGWVGNSVHKSAHLSNRVISLQYA